MVIQDKCILVVNSMKTKQGTRLLGDIPEIQTDQKEPPTIHYLKARKHNQQDKVNNKNRSPTLGAIELRSALPSKKQQKIYRNVREVRNEN